MRDLLLQNRLNPGLEVTRRVQEERARIVFSELGSPRPRKFYQIRLLEST